ncbi:MAG: beta-propeller domain-containing protein [Candidatus Verstraetearchaeota archaeon]|nr:beta-propeller domain-containing protein [Candidatus Verstraetearchaeota archaeon]
MKGNKVFTLFIILIIGVLILGYSTNPYSTTSIKSFESYDKIEEFIKAKLNEVNNNSMIYNFIEGIFYSITDMRISKSEPLVNSKTLEYSTTNVQVAGVDEADIVKTDGEYIYVISRNEVCIIKANPNNMQVVSRIVIEDHPIGLFINNNRLVIIKESYSKEFFKGRDVLPISRGVVIEIYDISKIENPKLIKSIYLEGNYVNSRMIEGYVYIITSCTSIEILNGNIKVLYPNIVIDGIVKKIPPEKIYYSNYIIAPLSYTVIVVIDIFQGDVAEYKAMLTGYASCIYVSLNNIYITMSKWKEGWDFTEIHRIGISGSRITIEASGEVPGRVLNQFSMDEYKGYFRIATTTGPIMRFFTQNTSNNVYVLEAKSLKVIGKIEGLAIGESIYSARFMRDMCYLVTFKKVDPLFTIDLTNPKEPKVLGELKISGYSEYLHPYDENYLIGIGKEAIPADEGNFAWYQGVKISLFDISNVKNPREIDSIVIGDRGTETPVLKDHHAFLFDKKRSLVIIPILEAKIFHDKYSKEIPPWTYGDYVFQGVYVFHITPEYGIKIRGKITHIEDSELLNMGYYFKYEIKRSLIIDNVLYTISDVKIKANSLIDLSSISEIYLK